MRLLSLDVGDRRIGAALSDPLGITATPLLAIDRKRVRDAVAAVLDLAREHEVSGIVVGFPLTLSGEAAHQAAKVKDFVRVLESRTELPVVAVDERFSTQEAERLLRSAGRRARSRYKGAVDSAAAAVILQTYLDALAAESHRSLPQSSGEG